jgi:transposase-like protein
MQPCLSTAWTAPAKRSALVNEAAKIERAEFLGAAPYERTASRRDYANGFKPKIVLTRLGEVTFEVPQVGSGDFYPSALEKGTRTDQAVNLALAEMYVQGVSTWRVIEVLQRLLGPEISLSSAQVRRAAAKLSEGLKAWRERPLGEVPYLFLDVRYEKVCLEGRIVDCAVLIAVGIDASGHRRVLGCDIATSEAEINWRSFLESLLARGLKGVKLIVADDHAGLKAARRAVLPSVPWQRCQFHLQQNAGQFVTPQEAKKTVAAQMRAIFNAPDNAEAQRLLQSAVDARRKDHPKLAQWAEEAIVESLTVFDFLAAHRIRLRTTNGLERINRELRRRIRVASIFPNPDSCLRLVLSFARRTGRRVRPSRSIATSTRKPGVMPTKPEIYGKEAAQS